MSLSNEVLAERIASFKQQTEKDREDLSELEGRTRGLEHKVFAAAVIAGVLSLSGAGLVVWTMKLQLAVRGATANVLAAETTAKENIIHTANAEVRRAALAFLPVGTVVAWPGKNLPEGDAWAICKGQSFKSADAREKGWSWELLREALGQPQDNPYGSDLLPNYQGYFLRGVISPGDRDKDLADAANEHRTPIVGSVQKGAIESHDHPLTHSKNLIGVDNPGTKTASVGVLGLIERIQTGEAGGSETRPINVYVNWIIKVK